MPEHGSRRVPAQVLLRDTPARSIRPPAHWIGSAAKRDPASAIPAPPIGRAAQPLAAANLCSPRTQPRCSSSQYRTLEKPRPLWATTLRMTSLVDGLIPPSLRSRRPSACSRRATSSEHRSSASRTLTDAGALPCTAGPFISNRRHDARYPFRSSKAAACAPEVSATDITTTRISI